MDGSLTTAIATAGISATAAGIAIWQARIAKDQAKTAENAAALAERQAVAAEQQVKAAEDQVALMRRQLDAEDADRRDARGPQFAVTEGWVDRVTDNNFVTAVVTLKQTAGPRLTSIVATAAGPVMEDARSTQAQCGPLAAGGSATITFDLDWDAPSEGRIVLSLDCLADTGESWQRSISHDLVKRPEEPAPWRVRRGR